MAGPSRWEPVGELRRVPIAESGEPLLDYLAACHRLRRDRPRYRYRYETLLRQGVVERLCLAAERLPTGIFLSIIEGWRAPHIQARMYQATWNWWKDRHPEWSQTTLRRIVNRFSAPVDNKKVPPPHTTGGAVDLTLVNEKGEALDLCSPYAAFDPRSYPFAVPHLSATASCHRHLLRNILESVGVTNYPGEYWHWSYGDQGWAYRGGHSRALYGKILPPNWMPASEDQIDSPLEMNEG